jgi:radical SAM protein with 4Fe4S-binding SPASM domain
MTQGSDRGTGKAPFCTALHTAVCVDPNKDVRPCCTYFGNMGNLSKTPLTEILKSPRWEEVKQQIVRGETPNGCLNCLETEKASGWSVRKAQFDVSSGRSQNWSKGLTFLEINSTNVCNLACAHCSADFSSRWVELREEPGFSTLNHNLGAGGGINKPDPERILEQLSQQDLTSLEIVQFKGGEPMLNKDVPAVLKHLSGRGILGNVAVRFVSNGSIVNHEVLDLLGGAKSTHICLSVDGTGALQKYIRQGPSGTDRIEAFIAEFATLESITFSVNVSVMAFNVFHLDQITDWWHGIRSLYPDKTHPLVYGSVVSHPRKLSLSVLQDDTRLRLIEKYRAASGADYGSVIQCLQQPFGGPDRHDEFVRYTREHDKLWKSNILDVVPELAGELVLLAPARSAEETFREGLLRAENGEYQHVVKVYEEFLSADSGSTPEMSWNIRLHLAYVREKLNDWPQALSEFRSLVCIAPDLTLRIFAPAASESTNVYRQAPVIRLLLSEPAYPPFVEGLAHSALKDRGVAVARLEEALRLNPNFGMAALALQELGDAEVS